MNALSGVLFIIAYIPYVIAIINRETIPSPVSWSIWLSVDTLALIAMRKEGAKTGQLTGTVIGGWIIVALSIVFGKPTIELVELVSIIGAVAGIVLWQKTKNAIFAIICAQAATFIASVPTFVNAYTNPTQENPIAWSLWFVSCICALLAIKKWNLANALQPITFTVIETTMIILVVIRPLFS